MTSQTEEILHILQEECAEVIQAISKCQRFGFNNAKPGTDKTNLDQLQEELGDVMAMVELLVEQKIGVQHINITKAKANKFDKLKKWSTISTNK
jgi:NTP pyrophosphatase (non-canonical NTP hydrolase)